MKKKFDCAMSIGNVFEDLGLASPDERMLKAQLAVQICRFIEAKEWTQTEAAEAIGIDQPKVIEPFARASCGLLN